MYYIYNYIQDEILIRRNSLRGFSIVLRLKLEFHLITRIIKGLY